MNGRVSWTATLESKLLALRAGGLTWDQTARQMGLGRNTVLERGRRIGADRPKGIAEKVLLEPCDRPPWPPGHPVTWNLLTDGTPLDGEPYPYPVFL